jgi:predicted metal-binding protein
MNQRTTLTICRTCRPEDAAAADVPPGAELGRAAAQTIARRGLGDRIEARAIACLSACSRACSAAVAAPGKFSYVIGELGPADAEALVTFALRHAESADGIPPWRERPEKIRKNTLARVPPGGSHALVEDIVEDEVSLRR